jgi:hypothetical protein
LLLFNAGRATTLEQIAGRAASDARPLLSTSLPTPGSPFALAASSATVFALAERAERS